MLLKESAYPLTSTLERIAYLASLNDAATYLEIGVAAGATFHHVDFPVKVAVDPFFAFDPSLYSGPGIHYFQMRSDDFFDSLDGNRPITRALAPEPGEKIRFDIILIDGLHTFQQSWRDFENSLKYAHDKTLWLLDDTVPSDAFSAIPNLRLASHKKKQVGLNTMDWHGDVFKTVFALRDRYPEYSYCTVMSGNPQTIVWKAEPREVQALFPDFNKINHLSYIDMLRYADVLAPVSENMVPDLIGKKQIPETGRGESWRKLIYSPTALVPFKKITPQDKLYVNHLRDPLRAIEKAVKTRILTWRNRGKG